MKELARRHPDKVIDALTERLTFERAGVELYDTIAHNIERVGSPEDARLLPTMRVHRDHEKEHEEWLEQQIRELGGDAHGQTELGELITMESAGVQRVVMSDANVFHQLHALLIAELVDNAGWELLLELADDADDPDARRELRKRLHEEEEHLFFVRRAVAALARQNVLGKAMLLPTSP